MGRTRNDDDEEKHANVMCRMISHGKPQHSTLVFDKIFVNLFSLRMCAASANRQLYTLFFHIDRGANMACNEKSKRRKKYSFRSHNLQLATQPEFPPFASYFVFCFAFHAHSTPFLNYNNKIIITNLASFN